MSKNKKSPNWIFVSGKYNIILFVLLAIINVSLAYIMRGLTSFSNLSKALFIIINVVVLLVLLILLRECIIRRLIEK